MDVFSRASAVRIIYISDTELSARTDNDIRTYLENNLPLNIFKKHGSQLVQKAEGLFQWVAVACGFILKPPAGLTKRKCIRDLLALSSNHGGLNLLDRLYAQVLEAYFTTHGARYQFQSIIGPLLAACKPLSISSLTSCMKVKVESSLFFDPVLDLKSEPSYMFFELDGSKFVYQTLSWLLTIWLDLGENKVPAQHETFKKMIDNIVKSIRDAPVYKVFTSKASFSFQG